MGDLRKRNNVVEITCQIKANSAMNAWTNGFGNIPGGYRPAHAINLTGIIHSTSEAVRVQITAGGAITLGKALKSGDIVYFAGSYVS